MKEMGSGSISFQIKFQAVGDGSTTLKVDTTEMYDVNDNSLDTPSATKTVKVIGSADSDDVIQATQAETQEATAINETMESGVDEKGDEGEMTGGYLLLIISAAVLAVIIAVIAAVLIKKRGGKGKGPKGSKGPNGPEDLGAEEHRRASTDTMVLEPDAEPVSRNTRMFHKGDFEQETAKWEDQEDRWPDDDRW